MIDTPATWQSRLPFFYGWAVVAVALSTTFFGIGLIWSASIFANSMTEELDWSNSAFFFALSLRGWTGIVIAPIVGPYLDRQHGIRALAIGGGLINVAALVLISQVQEEWQFVLLFGVVGGVAQALQMGATVIIPKWFVRRRGMAVSLASAGGGLAALTLPTLLVAVESALSWRSGWLLLACWRCFSRPSRRCCCTVSQKTWAYCRMETARRARVNHRRPGARSPALREVRRSGLLRSGC